MKMLDERPLRPLTVPAVFSLGIVDETEAAVARSVDRAELLFRHVLDGDGQRAAKAGDGK